MRSQGDYPEDTRCPLLWSTSSWGQLRLPVLPERSLIKRSLVIWVGAFGSKVRNMRVWPISHLWGCQLLESGQQAPFRAVSPTVPSSGHGRAAANAGQLVGELLGWGTVWRSLKVRRYKGSRSANFPSPERRGSSSLVQRWSPGLHLLSDS